MGSSSAGRQPPQFDIYGKTLAQLHDKRPFQQARRRHSQPPPPPRNPKNGDLDLQRSHGLFRWVSRSAPAPTHFAIEAGHEVLTRPCVHSTEAARATGGGFFPLADS